MRCIERRAALRRWLGALGAALLAGSVVPAVAADEPTATATATAETAAATETATSAEAAAPASPPRYLRLASPATPRNAVELRLRLAQRLVASHPDTSYLSRTPERLWAIPVLQVDLNADGSVRKIVVLRHPTTGDQATELAIAAVKRAAPYGRVAKLPKPWTVVETFLFDDDLRFKPRTLDTE